MTPPPTNRNLRLAACAVAFAAAVGGSTHSSAGELEAIDKIERYCTVSWRNAGIARQEWDDCTQTALVELLDRISSEGLDEAISNMESSERRELNRTVWRTVQRWRRRPRQQAFDDAKASDFSQNHDRNETDHSWEQIVSAGESCLSERQQTILSMMRDGWRVAEIASSLQIPQARVSDEKYKAICKLRGVMGIA
ncbi:MAG: sigma-70 family RNA polymerase sigma factor [Planctomycetaceae bacterium]|nr:sigma-70 family RNA polymerase sigma factor [Planctomycetales bacterium]MCB9920723.1 sigma-70 family RNA polymerase sigma factor [Planctomycetaceae bacterium]